MRISDINEVWNLDPFRMIKVNRYSIGFQLNGRSNFFLSLLFLRKQSIPPFASFTLFRSNQLPYHVHVGSCLQRVKNKTNLWPAIRMLLIFFLQVFLLHFAIFFSPIFFMLHTLVRVVYYINCRSHYMPDKRNWFRKRFTLCYSKPTILNCPLNQNQMK